MSWNVTLIGKPDKIEEALDRKRETLDGQNKVEFEAALPHMIGLVRLNYANGLPYTQSLVKLDAASMAVTRDGRTAQGAFRMNLETIYGDLLI